jgi:hypothetical protein
MAGEASDIVAPYGRLVRGALTGWAVLVYFFLFAPIILLVLFSFNANSYGTLPITGWTTHWYRDAFNDLQIQDAVKTTLQVALEVTVLSTFVGTAAAFPLVRSNLPFRSGVRAALTLPIMIPGLLIGVSLLSFFTSVLHMQLSNQTAVIGQSVFTTPFVILVVASRLEGFDRSLEQAASDLGEPVAAPTLCRAAPDRARDLCRGDVRVHALAGRVRDHAVPDRRRQHPPDLHLHAGQVWDHPGDQCDRIAADRRFADPGGAGVRRAAPRARPPPQAAGTRAGD